MNNNYLLPLFFLLIFIAKPLQAGSEDRQTDRRPKAENKLLIKLIGDSTVKNGQGKGDNDQWGWGSFFERFFDTTRVTVENHALGGRSSRTFITEGLWNKVLDELQEGEYLFIQFGHNDGGPLNTGRARASLKGTGNESQAVIMKKTGEAEEVFTYGHYLRTYIRQTKAKGAIPVVLSHTPGNSWMGDKMIRNSDTYGKWSKEVAQQEEAFYIDLNDLIANKCEVLGKEKMGELFKDRVHTTYQGAILNCEALIEGITAIPELGLNEYINVPPATLGRQYNFSNEKGNTSSANPFFLSVNLPEGNYKVTVTLGNKEYPTNTTIRAESRRLMLENVNVPKGAIFTKSFVVNTRNKWIGDDDSVRIKPREVGKLNWDNKLSLEVNGTRPGLLSLNIEPVTVPTLFLAGNSTVVDQDDEPWCGWGQMLPRFLNDKIAVANYAESGEAANSFISSKRFEKILAKMQVGDFLLIEFGHNDQKQKGENRGPYTSYKESLKFMVDETRKKGATPILVTPVQRRNFDKDNKVINTLGDFPDAMRQLAEEEEVMLIDLNEISRMLYEAWGPEESKKAFVHYPAGTFPGQDKALEDNTHFNTYGGYQVCKSVVSQMAADTSPLKQFIANDFGSFDPAHPDDVNRFYIPPTPSSPESPVAGFNISELEWVKEVGARTEPAGKEPFNVTSYGAVADGATLNTKAIQAAINACHQVGGGIVTFTPGNYLTGSIYLKEGVHLVIPEGTTLLGSQRIEDYPDIPTRVAGIEMVWPSALINVIGQRNVKISGKGKVDGQGKPFWDRYWEMRKEYESKGLRWIVDYDCERPRTLLISQSEDITVGDVTFEKAGFWTIHLLYSRYCTVDGVTIRNNIGGHGPSTDGIDIDSSSFILVENCDIDCNDDNFCLKAGRDADGLRVNKPTEYVVIRNCISRAGGGLFTCGSETSGGIRHVLAHDLKAKGTSVGLRFKSAMNRGGTTQHIYLKDIEMEEVGIAIEASMNWNPSYSYSALPEELEGKELPEHWNKMLEVVTPERGTPYFNNIHFSGIKAANAKRAFSVTGSEASKVEEFTLQDIAINAEQGGSIKHARNWTIENVRIRSDNDSDNNNRSVHVSDSENVRF